MPDLAPDPVDEMIIEVRASTQGFAEDMARMRRDLDGNLVAGFTRAGEVLERSLTSAIRRGSLGFEDLRATASKVIDQIAAQALQLGLSEIFGKDNPLGGVFGNVLGDIFGLPGRATGGPVSAHRGYLVGERGPELFVPPGDGRVVPLGQDGGARRVSVSIQLAAPAGTGAPVALERSSRQIAAAVRRVMENT